MVEAKVEEVEVEAKVEVVEAKVEEVEVEAKVEVVGRVPSVVV